MGDWIFLSNIYSFLSSSPRSIGFNMNYRSLHFPLTPNSRRCIVVPSKYNVLRNSVFIATNLTSHTGKYHFACNGHRHLSSGDCTSFYSAIFPIHPIHTYSSSLILSHTHTHSHCFLRITAAMALVWSTKRIKNGAIPTMRAIHFTHTQWAEQIPSPTQHEWATSNWNCSHPSDPAFLKCSSISLQSRLPRTTQGDVFDGILKVNLTITNL